MRKIIDILLIGSVALYLVIGGYMHFVHQPHLASYLLSVPLLGGVLFVTYESINVRWIKFLTACGIGAIALSLSFYYLKFYKDIFYISPWFEFLFPILPLILIILAAKLQKWNIGDVLNKIHSTKILNYSLVPALGLVSVIVGKAITYLFEAWTVSNRLIDIIDRALDILSQAILGGGAFFGAGSFSFLTIAALLLIVGRFTTKTKGD